VVDFANERAESVLHGKTVFVSRAREECAELSAELETRGAQVIASPLLRFALPEDLVPLDTALGRLGEFDWWLITSRHAVEFAVARSYAIGAPLAQLVRGACVGVVGTATAEAARRAGIAVACVAKQQSAVGLQDELASQVAGKRILLLRSNLADSVLPRWLAARGAEITDVICYRTLPPGEEEQKRLAAVSWQRVDAAVFFSPSAIRHLAEAIGPQKMKEATSESVSVAAGPTTAEAARRHGFHQCVEAEEPAPPAIISALEAWFANRQSRKMTGVHPG
jgi:uroporphyrinogen-III synthase